MTIVKICGVRSVAHAHAAALAGADLIGLVFAPSRRQVSPAQAAAIVAGLREHAAGQRVQIVGLFVNAEPADINHVSAVCGLDAVQLSGDETVAVAAAIRLPLIKALRLDGSACEADWLAAMTVSPPAGCWLPRAVLPLIDAHVAGVYGGTGQLADWERAALLAAEQPLMLAGGLTPENVGRAIGQVRPWAVDVSSGVEVAGQKDEARIAAFVAAVRQVG